MSWYFLPYIATVELGEGGHSSAQTELLQIGPDCTARSFLRRSTGT